MRAFLSIIFLLPLIITGTVLANAREDMNNAIPDRPIPPGDAPIWSGPTRAVLHDNGPFVTHIGTGVGGADESVLQSVTLLMNTLGFGHQVLSDNRVADDFTIPDGETWDISQITFFAYQTNSPTSSTITAVHFEIWDGVPGTGTLVFGDMATNRLVGSAWTGVYRVSETSIGTSSARPIMANICSPMAPLQLSGGTYWIAWQTGGTLSSGPWAPPITITGQGNTGNGRQSLAGGAYDPVTDSGNLAPQGFPFVIEGSTGPISVEPTTWSNIKALYR